MPKVSIIVPVYKVEPYIHQCVDSILQQTYTDLEVILLDDGSPDKCGEICDQYAEKDSRVRVVHLENGGQGRARNIGVDMARGEYIEFVDSDDWILPDTVEYLVSEAESKSLDLLLFSARSFVDGNPEEFNTVINEYNRTQNLNIVMDGVTCYQKMTDSKEYHVLMGIRFISASFYRRQGLRFGKGKLREDEGIAFLSVVLAERVEILDKKFYQRRYRPGSAVTAKTNMSSLLGYASAFSELAEAYNQRKPSGVMGELYLERLKLYLERVIKTFMHSDPEKKEQIFLETQRFLKIGIKCGVPFEKKLIIAERSLFRYETYLRKQKKRNLLKSRIKRYVSWIRPRSSE